MQKIDILKKFATKTEGSIGKAALTLALTFGLSALLGFVRSRLLYGRFFSCCAQDLDVFNAAFRIPDMLFNLLVSGALTSSFIPIFSSYIHKNKEAEAQTLASAVLSLLVLVFTSVSIIAFIFARPLSILITPGFSTSQIDLLVQSTRVLLLAQIFFLISNFLTGMIQSYRIFLVPSLSPMLYNLAIIASIFVFAPTFGIIGVIYGALLGSILHLAIQYPIAKKLGFNFSWNPNFNLPGVKKVASLMLPRSLSLGLGEVESTIVLYWATTFASGSLSLFKLSLQVVYLPSRIFGVSLGQASLPTLSKLIAENRTADFKATLKSAILKTIFIAFPISIICLVNRLPIIRLAYGSKEFPWLATLDTAKALGFLVPTIFAQALIQIVNRAFYAVHDTKTPLLVALISLIATLVTSFVLAKNTQLGISGLSISVSVGSIVQLIGLFIMFSKTKVDLSVLSLFTSSLKTILASSIMGFVVWGTMRSLDIYILDTTKTLSVALVFFGSSLFGLAIYLTILLVLNSDELAWVMAKLKR